MSGKTPVAWLVGWRENPRVAVVKEKRPPRQCKRFATLEAAEDYKALLQSDDCVVCITPVNRKFKPAQDALLDGDFCRDWQMKS